jgi:hypothetical protein
MTLNSIYHKHLRKLALRQNDILPLSIANFLTKNGKISGKIADVDIFVIHF